MPFFAPDPSNREPHDTYEQVTSTLALIFCLPCFCAAALIPVLAQVDVGKSWRKRFSRKSEYREWRERNRERKEEEKARERGAKEEMKAEKEREREKARYEKEEKVRVRVKERDDGYSERERRMARRKGLVER